ncbi:MAG: hypothetical protein IBJ10_04305 [Phycisphaerales bacterium]|nr:hypothetical protein [Phycisphaerales bacterium]
MGLLNRRAIGLLPVGDDLILVEATARAHGVAWRRETVAGFFSGDAPAPDWARAGAHTPRVLLWPTDAMLRREIDIAGQSIDDFRGAIGESLGSFFPAVTQDGVLWDVAPITGAAGGPAAWIGVALRDRVQPVLDRLQGAGLAPTRLAPSGMALPLLLRSVDADRRPTSVLEVTPTGWALHAVDGLRWNGCRAGSGPPTDAALREAERCGAPTLRWDDADAPGLLTRDDLAMGGAMLGAWPRLGSEQGRAPSFNLLGRRERRSFLEHPAARWTGAAAAVVAGVMILGDATVARARAERGAIATRASQVVPDFERVEDAREVNERLTAAHERLWRLESTYTPRWRTLAALSVALPAPAWVERVEVGDDTILADVIAPGAAQVLEALEASADFEKVKQIGPAAALESGETRLRIEAQLVRAGGPAPDAPAAREGGAE